jgi:hypothetical protein
MEVNNILDRVLTCTHGFYVVKVDEVLCQGSHVTVLLPLSFAQIKSKSETWLLGGASSFKAPLPWIIVVAYHAALLAPAVLRCSSPMSSRLP